MGLAFQIKPEAREVRAVDEKHKDTRTRAKDKPTVIAFSCLGSALEKAGEWHQTLTLLGDMTAA